MRRVTISSSSAWMKLALACVIVAGIVPGQAPAETKKVFRAGAFAVNVSPTAFPVNVNGGMRERTATKIVDPLHARCLVLDDGTTKIAIAVVDSCMIPRDLLDQAKQLASKAT
ncbi:MAG: hypothetical protein N2C14_10415, partial [Planctomycetales bacterium]